MTDSSDIEAPASGPDESASEVVQPAVPENSGGDQPKFQHLAPQQITLERRVGYIVTLIIGATVLIGTSPALLFAWSRPWVAVLVIGCWILLLTVLVYSAHFWPPIAYRHASWRLTDTGLEIRRGVWWRHRIAVPVARVQHVDVSQGPFQRMLDLGKLTVHTAGTRNASIELDGLEHLQAMRLRDQLIEQKESLDVT